MEKKVAPLHEVFQELITSGVLGPDPAVSRILEIWPSLLPEALRPFVLLEGVRDGVLVVLVGHPVAGQQMQFIKEDLRGRINRALGRTLIRELRVKMGPLPPQAEPERKTLAKGHPNQPRSLTRKEKGAIKRLTEEIKDDELRKRLRTLMEKSLGFSAPEFAGPRENKRRAARKPPKGAGPSILPPRS